jgi:hypothetical protein
MTSTATVPPPYTQMREPTPSGRATYAHGTPWCPTTLVEPSVAAGVAPRRAQSLGNAVA